MSASVPSRRATFAPCTVLARRVSTWLPGTRVNILEPFRNGLLVEVLGRRGDTLDVILVRRDMLTVVG